MMAVPRWLVASTPFAEIMALDDTSALKQAHGAIDRRQRDAGVAGAGAAMDLLHVGVVFRLRQDLGDDAALAGHAHAPLGAEPLDPAFPCR